MKNGSLRPKDAVVIYREQLSCYEFKEILAYPKVFFVGHHAKKHEAQIDGISNGGYDDQDGFYKCVPNDHIAYRYELIKVLGKGTYGQVVKALDHKTGIYVALKLVRNVKRFCKEAEQEIQMLEWLKKRDADNSMNIVHILDHFTFRNHKCMTFELLGISLYDLIQAENGIVPYSTIQQLSLSILQCLVGLYRLQVIHCDLKPENILLKQNRAGHYEIKVIDFGSACTSNSRAYTYVQSRFYRAPEVILGADYGTSIDMWSFGCILAELYTGRPLFLGKDEADQIACITDLLGPPPASLLDQARRAHLFFSAKGQPRYCSSTIITNGLKNLVGRRNRRGDIPGRPSSQTWSQVLKGCRHNLFICFIRNCLEWDPAARLKPVEAVEHPWIVRARHKVLSSNVSNESSIGKKITDAV